MKSLTLNVITIIFMLGVISTTFGREKTVLRPERIKAFWRMPVSTQLAASASYFEIRYCEEEDHLESCEVKVDQISLAQLRVRGEFEVRAKRNSIELFYYEAPDKSDASRVALQDMRFDWFPPAELCHHPREKLDCRYELVRRDDADGIDLVVTYSK